ncbi:unnamed protein product [Dracunculus medinensis]|uniref:Uncharacterized protein n=1 Tax=Dracunculus medinensis TaxID=318479 RepID=A0A3P7QVF8_DRAME|nr:unnamed protein product [Dracunculus medinensis]
MSMTSLNDRRYYQNSNTSQCNCCPYGFHIELDFVKFAENISKGNFDKQVNIYKLNVIFRYGKWNDSMRIEMVSIGTSTPPLLPLKRCVECLKMKQQIDSLKTKSEAVSEGVESVEELSKRQRTADDYTDNAKVLGSARAEAIKKLLTDKCDQSGDRSEKQTFKRSTKLSKSYRVPKNKGDDLQYIVGSIFRKFFTASCPSTPQTNKGALKEKVVLKKETVIKMPPSKVPEPVPARIPRPKFSRYSPAEATPQSPDEVSLKIDFIFELEWAVKYVQHQWLKTTARKTSSPIQVKGFIDAVKEISISILNYIVNITDQNENTALHYAVSHGNLDVVSVLLDTKLCDLNFMNKAGYTPVMLAALYDASDEIKLTVIQRIFEMGDVNIKANKHAQTALMLAASHGNVNTTRILLQCNADVNIQDEEGSTALMCAAEHGHKEIVKLLLKHPTIDASLSDCDSSTALSIAVENGHRDIGVLIYAHLNYTYNDRFNKS